MKLKNSIKKQQKWPNLTRVNLSNSCPSSWDQDNHIESKSKQIMRLNSQSIKYWRIKLKKKIKKDQKKTWINLDSGHDTGITLKKENKNKLWNLILNQPNIEGWNWKKKLKSTRVSLENSQIGSWDQDNLVMKLKKSIKK